MWRIPHLLNPVPHFAFLHLTLWIKTRPFNYWSPPPMANTARLLLYELGGSLQAPSLVTMLLGAAVFVTTDFREKPVHGTHGTRGTHGTQPAAAAGRPRRWEHALKDELKNFAQNTPAFELKSEPWFNTLRRLARKTRCVRSTLPRVQAAGKARASLKADKRHGCTRYSQPLACSTRATSSLVTRAARLATPLRCGRTAGTACCSTATHGGL